MSGVQRRRYSTAAAVILGEMVKHWFFERKEQNIFAKYTDSSDGINSLTSTPFGVVDNVTCWANKPEQDGGPRYSILVHHDIGTHVYIVI